MAGTNLGSGPRLFFERHRFNVCRDRLVHFTNSLNGEPGKNLVLDFNFRVRFWTDFIHSRVNKVRDADPFERWLNDYYAKDSSFSDYFNKTVEPLIESITHSVNESVKREVGDFDAD